MSAVKAFDESSPRFDTISSKAEAKPLGFLVGWKAFRIFTALSELNDAELARNGLTRIDLPRAAAIGAGLFRG